MMYVSPYQHLNVASRAAGRLGARASDGVRSAAARASVQGALADPPPPPQDYWQTREEARAQYLRDSAEAAQRRRLRWIDARVRAHEATHLAAAGVYATGGASYSYMIGPDGQRYAVGGSVGVDVSPVPGNPRETIRKMRAIRRAALAPGQPSSADMRVAAKAYRLEQEAQEKIDARQNGPRTDVAA